MDKRFDEIVAYLEKRFDVKINVADRALAERRFIASVRQRRVARRDARFVQCRRGDAHSPRRPHRQHHQTLTLKRNRPWNKIDPRKKGGDIRTIPARSSGRELYTPSTEPKPNKCMKKPENLLTIPGIKSFCLGIVVSAALFLPSQASADDIS
ncbi:MAG: DUF4974 domain-containing protein [Alistipes communis]